MIRLTVFFQTSFLRHAACSASCALLGACGGGDDTGPPFAARDSAGVRIAESRAPAWADGEEWTIGATALTDVPVGRTPFHAARLADGRMLLALDGERTAALFGARGEPLGTVRPAYWPEGITWVGTGAGDSLLVWQPRRLSVFTPDGRLARQVRPRGLDYLAPRMVGRLADGSLLVTRGHQEPLSANLPQRGLIGYRRVGPGGESLNPFADLPGERRMVATGSYGSWEVPFSTRTLVAVSGGEVLVGDNAEFEIAAFSPGGAPKRIVRRAWEPLPVDEADVEAFHARMDPPAAGYTGEALAAFQRARSARREQLPYEKTFPAFTRLMAGADGTVWAEEPRHLHDYWRRLGAGDGAGRHGAAARPRLSHRAAGRGEPVR